MSWSWQFRLLIKASAQRVWYSTLSEGHPSPIDCVCSLMMAVEGLVLSIPNFLFTQCPIFWSKKGLPPGPVVRMVVSAGRLLPWQAWYFARASAHSFPAIPARDLRSFSFSFLSFFFHETLLCKGRCGIENYDIRGLLGHGDDASLGTTLFHNLVEWGKAVCGNTFVSYICAGSSN